MTAFITGASGFIGSHLACHLVNGGEKVVSLIHNCPVWNKWLQKSIKPTIRVRGDIRNINFLKNVLNQYEISKVYHLAALSIVKRAWKDPVNTFEINVLGTVNLLEACRQLDIEKVLVQSSDKVYGNEMNVDTGDRLKPTEIYGSSKICTDVIAQTFIETYGMDIAISRCCNVYGYDWNNRIIPNTIRACLRNENPVIFRNDDSKRQYIHVDDAVRALEYYMNSKLKEHIANIGTDDILSQEEVVLNILKFFPDLKPKYVDKPSLSEIKNQSMKIRLSGWMPHIGFEDGIKRTIDAFRKYREDVRMGWAMVVEGVSR